ncbi:MAG: FAD-dependent oxidoreductase, partial [Armatimonadetes bacterium]|nr:FAD-dependent oxidoreductase [Armatimonadota bacterium]
VHAQRHMQKAVAALAEAELVRPALVWRLPCLAPGEALLPTLQLRHTPRVLAAGSLAGAAGYCEAMATGHIAGMNAARLAMGREPAVPPEDTLIGQICRTLAHPPEGHSGLVQANFGMLPEVPGDDNSKQARHHRQAERALRSARAFGKEQS